MKYSFTKTALAVSSLLISLASMADVVVSDPTGDDFGPGTYTYPTDPVYQSGSFDLTAFRIKEDGANYVFEVDVANPLKDAWNTGVGFDVQMAFIFIDAGKGIYSEGLPGLNIEFAPSNEWQKVVLMSPQSARRLQAELRKARTIREDIVIPSSTSGASHTIKSVVAKSDIPGKPSDWRFQVVMQSNEGFPEGKDMLTRKVNATNSAHRFGGGADGKCDPHVLDILGDHKQLSYECTDSGSSVRMAQLTLQKQ